MSYPGRLSGPRASSASTGRGSAGGDLYRAVGNPRSAGQEVRLGASAMDTSITRPYSSERKVSATDFQSSAVRRVNSPDLVKTTNHGPPSLPVDLARFPVQPYHAVFRTSYNDCFDAVSRVLGAPDAVTMISSLNREEGWMECIVVNEEDGAFRV